LAANLACQDYAAVFTTATAAAKAAEGQPCGEDRSVVLTRKVGCQMVSVQPQHYRISIQPSTSNLRIQTMVSPAANTTKWVAWCATPIVPDVFLPTRHTSVVFTSTFRTGDG